MKKNVFVYFILFAGCILAQTDSVRSALLFYPLNTGDYWEYTLYDGSDPYHASSTGKYSMVVAGDSVMENGASYKLINKKYSGSPYTVKFFERCDTSDACVYRYESAYEYKIDSLLAQPGDKIKASHFGYLPENLPEDFRIYCLGIDTVKLFDNDIIVKSMNDDTRIPNEFYKLGKGIGRLSNWGWEGNYWEESLTYARINGIEYGTKSGIEEEALPLEFMLFQNYPNPFNPETTIKYSIPAVETRRGVSLHITIIVYDILGREIQTLVNENKSPGNYEVKFTASNLPSGIYFYRIQYGSYSGTKKMLLLK